MLSFFEQNLRLFLSIHKKKFELSKKISRTKNKSIEKFFLFWENKKKKRILFKSFWKKTLKLKSVISEPFWKNYSWNSLRNIHVFFSGESAFKKSFLFHKNFWWNKKYFKHNEKRMNEKVFLCSREMKKHRK